MVVVGDSALTRTFPETCGAALCCPHYAREALSSVPCRNPTPRSSRHVAGSSACGLSRTVGDGLAGADGWHGSGVPYSPLFHFTGFLQWWSAAPFSLSLLLFLCKLNGGPNSEFGRRAREPAVQLKPFSRTAAHAHSGCRLRGQRGPVNITL